MALSAALVVLVTGMATPGSLAAPRPVSRTRRYRAQERRAPGPSLPAKGAPFWRGAFRTEHWPVVSQYQLALAEARRLRPVVLVFVFHQVCPTDWPLRNGPDYIAPARLGEDFAFFRAHHIHEPTASQFTAFAEGKLSVPNGSVFLAFDNGLEGVCRYAYPVVRAYHVHISLFVIGNRTHAVWKPGGRYQAWDRLLTMRHSGLVDVELETCDLHSIERVSRHRSRPAILRTWESHHGGYPEPVASWER